MSKTKKTKIRVKSKSKNINKNKNVIKININTGKTKTKTKNTRKQSVPVKTNTVVHTTTHERTTMVPQLVNAPLPINVQDFYNQRLSDRERLHDIKHDAKLLQDIQKRLNLLENQNIPQVRDDISDITMPSIYQDFGKMRDDFRSIGIENEFGGFADDESLSISVDTGGILKRFTPKEEESSYSVDISKAIQRFSPKEESPNIEEKILEQQRITEQYAEKIAEQQRIARQNELEAIRAIRKKKESEQPEKEEEDVIAKIKEERNKEVREEIERAEKEEEYIGKANRPKTGKGSLYEEMEKEFEEKKLGKIKPKFDLEVKTSLNDVLDRNPEVKQNEMKKYRLWDIENVQQGLTPIREEEQEQEQERRITPEEKEQMGVEISRRGRPKKGDVEVQKEVDRVVCPYCMGLYAKSYINLHIKRDHKGMPGVKFNKETGDMIIKK